MTETPPKITCIGLANVDVIASVPESFIQKHSIAKSATSQLSAQTTGMLLGQLDSPEFHPGGCAANTACGLSYFDIPTRYIGKTGDDTYAGIFRKGFEQNDVLFNTPPFGSKMTSTCLTLVTPDKDRSFALCTDTAGWYLSTDDLPELTDKTCPYVYLEANTALMAKNNGTNLLKEAVKKYEPQGVKIILNLNDREVVREARDTLTGLLDSGLFSFIGNVGEAHTLFNTSNLDDLFEVALDSGQNFAITDGPNGAYIVNNDEVKHVPAVRLHRSRIVNTIGAGDQFAAGFVSGLIKGLPFDEACRKGIQAATTIIQTMSARPEKAALKQVRQRR